MTTAADVNKKFEAHGTVALETLFRVIENVFSAVDAVITTY